ncbi:hypothetical protein D521_1609 [beta proteobacterium CB]|nr:hypothetical protein D521_1609 [beta proteobacterium CB]
MELKWFSIDVCSHNPLAPGSSPSGLTRNKNISFRVDIVFDRHLK